MNEAETETKKAVGKAAFKNGVAIVFEPDGRIFLLEHDKPGPIDGTGVHLGSYMQATKENTTTREAGEYPYKEFHEALRRMYAVHHTHALVLDCVNPKLPQGLRSKLARTALAALDDASTKEAVTTLFGQKPFPATSPADMAGLPKAFCKFIRPFLPVTTR